MKSARDCAAYMRQHSAVAAIQRQAAEQSKSQPSSGRNIEGALRRRRMQAMQAQDGRSLPDAAAAAALISSAAARRTSTASATRHGAARQLIERQLTCRKVRSQSCARHCLHGTRHQHIACIQQMQPRAGAATEDTCAEQTEQNEWDRGSQIAGQKQTIHSIL
jgi:hypothetical protein